MYAALEGSGNGDFILLVRVITKQQRNFDS